MYCSKTSNIYADLFTIWNLVNVFFYIFILMPLLLQLLINLGGLSILLIKVFALKGDET